jgi:hypothetical protein
MTPHCHNRAEFGPYQHATGEIPHRMSQPCRTWATGDRATPVPVRENWNCAGCRWLPREDILRFAQITDEPETMAKLVELAA